MFKWKPRCSPFRIAYQFWIWPIPSYLTEPPCALRTPSTCSWSQCKQYNTIQLEDPKKKHESTVGYNFRSFQGWPPNLYSNESLGSPFSEKHINFEFGQFLHTLKCLRVRFALLIQLEDQKKKYESTVGYNFRSFLRVANKFLFKWKPRFSPFRKTYQFWIWPIPSYLKEPPVCTSHSFNLLVFSVETIQYSVKTKNEIWIYGWV